MPISFEELEREYRLGDLLILSKLPDNKPCGKCGQYAMIRVDYQDYPKDLFNRITLYACEWCGWNYVEQ